MPHLNPRRSSFWQQLNGCVLALMLLFAQQGGLLHELGHYAEDVAAHQQGEREKPHHHDSDLCETCLVFSHMAALATQVAFMPVLLAGLAFALGAQAEIASRTVGLLFLHNCGPPVAL